MNDVSGLGTDFLESGLPVVFVSTCTAGVLSKPDPYPDLTAHPQQPSRPALPHLGKSPPARNWQVATRSRWVRLGKSRGSVADRSYRSYTIPRGGGGHFFLPYHHRSTLSGSPRQVEGGPFPRVMLPELPEFLRLPDVLRPERGCRMATTLVNCLWEYYFQYL